MPQLSLIKFHFSKSLLAIFLLIACMWAVLSSAAVQASAAPVLDLERLASGENISQQIQYLEDVEGQFTLEQVLAGDWQSADENGLTFGYTSSVYWFRVSFSSQAINSVQRILNIAYPVLDYIEVFHRNTGESWQHDVLGDKQPFNQRFIEHRDFNIPLKISAQGQTEYLFRVETSSSMQFPVTLWKERDFFIKDIKAMLIIGIYYGIMLVMVFYNFFVYLATRDINYLYYVLFVACMALFLSALQGLAFQFLWPLATDWNDRSIVVFLGGTVLFAILFTRRFLYINHIRWINLSLGSFLSLIFFIMLFNQFFSYHLMIQSTILISIIFLVMALVAGIVRWSQGYSTARYYTIAWLVMLLGGIILAMNKFNIIPRNFLTEYILQIGSAIEVTLLSLALADRLNQEKRKRYQAQDQALVNERIARQAQYDAYQAQIKATETLEQRVKERTKELEQVNEKLQLMSITDPLTNVHNRRYFDQAMQSEMLRSIRSKEALSLLIIDIDYFKNVNDTYGHQAGDEVLKAVATHINMLIKRSTDVLARYGGEEFVLILPNTPLEGAVQLAQQIKEAIPKINFDHIAEGLVLHVSIGVFSEIPNTQSNYEHWIRNADDALYQAKEGGRNQLVVYQPDD